MTGSWTARRPTFSNDLHHARCESRLIQSSSDMWFTIVPASVSQVLLSTVMDKDWAMVGWK